VLSAYLAHLETFHFNPYPICPIWGNGGEYTIARYNAQVFF
jgi:hypothetical protein